MRSLIIVSAAALVLSACTATGSIDTAIKTSLPKTCALLETAHAAFIAASVSGNIKASTIAKEKAAYDGVHRHLRRSGKRHGCQRARRRCDRIRDHISRTEGSTIMGSISKALGAGVGGAFAGSAGVPFMPEGTPWYGYLALYALTIALPAVLTYLARRTSSNHHLGRLSSSGAGLFHHVRQCRPTRGKILTGRIDDMEPDLRARVVALEQKASDTERRLARNSGGSNPT